MAEKPTYEELKQRVRELEREAVERKRAEEQIGNYQFIVESAHDAIFFKDLESRYLVINAKTAESFGLPKEQVIGMNDYEIMPNKKEAMKNIEDDQFVFKTGKSKKITKHMTGTDGKEYWFQAIKVPKFDDKGKVVGLIGIARDITEQMRSEEEKSKLEARLQVVQKMETIGTLAGGIAHNFNNLLMSIQGNISLMSHGIDFSDPYYERLKNIEKLIQSGAKLTSHLLGYARKGKYQVIPISLNQIVNETSDTFGQTRKEIVIHKKFAEDLFVIDADNRQIEQILLNLFVNAADAMPDGGELILKTINVTHNDMNGKVYEPTPGNYVLLTVTDTGIGMDKSTMKQIFDPFFTTKKMGRGTGLGMASVYGITKAHGGYINVESMKKHGTTFKIYLPASKRNVRKVSKTSDKLIKGTGTVLLVDDDEAIQKVCKKLLEAIGYRIFTAKDGKEALKLYKKNQDKIDLVLLDMTMPNMSGSEVYDRMKEINPDVKVLLSSGYDIAGEAANILERGCNGFIQKPFNINNLSQKIAQVKGSLKNNFTF